MIYDEFKISAPIKGMNMNLEEEKLPSSYAASLVNFIPDPLGSITLRNGTEIFQNFEGAQRVNIIPFSKKDGTEDILSVYIEKITIQAYQNLEQFENYITFEKGADDQELKYIVKDNNFLLKTSKGSFIRKIQVSSFDFDTEIWTIQFYESIDQNIIGSINQISYYKSGVYYEDTLLYEFLPIYKMRGFSCLNKLLLCTGADPIHIFNEEDHTVSPLEQRVFLPVVKEDDLFRINIQNYPNCHLNKYVYVLNNDIRYDLYEKTDNSFKLRDSNGDPPIDGGVFTFVVYPPYSAFTTIIANRLWTLGEGGISLAFKDQEEALISYYSFRPGYLNQFLSPVTGLMPFLDLSGISNSQDSLERIEQFFNYLVFFGKKNIFFYKGFFPDVNGAFNFSNNIPVGIYHPDLLKKVGNDIIFVTEGGVSRLSTLNIGQQTEISDINGLDSFITGIQSKIEQDNYLYFDSAYYDYKKQLMFKLGSYEVPIFSVYNNQYIPYLYSGDFQSCTSLTEGRNGVYLCHEGNALFYQEENINEKDYAGDFIPFLWKTPTYSFTSRPFATQRVIFNAECDPSFSEGLKNKKSRLFLKFNGIKGISGRNFQIQKDIPIESFGDLLDGFSVKTSATYGILSAIQKIKSIKLILSKSSLIVSGETSSGRLRIKDLIVLGVMTRAQNG